jgi:hypothetical protein
LLLIKYHHYWFQWVAHLSLYCTALISIVIKTKSISLFNLLIELNLYGMRARIKRISNNKIFAQLNCQLVSHEGI